MPTEGTGSPLEYIKKFFKLLDLEVKQEDFKTLYVQNNRDKTGATVIGSFYNEWMKDKATTNFKKIRLTKQILLGDVMIYNKNDTAQHKPLVFRNNLTQHTGNLLTQARTTQQGI